MEIAEGLLTEDIREELNNRYTGDAKKTWVQELASRGPFERVAMLGSTSGYYEAQWLEHGGSREPDVYDICADLGPKTHARLGSEFDHRLHFNRADLNFISLAEGTYDLIFAVSTLDHLVRLEHLLGETRRALRPRGLFACGSGSTSENSAEPCLISCGWWCSAPSARPRRGSLERSHMGCFGAPYESRRSLSNPAAHSVTGSPTLGEPHRDSRYGRFVNFRPPHLLDLAP